MAKKQLFKTFLNIGIVQILPVFLAIISLVGIVVIIIALTFNPIYTPFPSQDRTANTEPYIPPSSDLLGLAVFSTVSLLFISGLVTLLISSFHFIRARQTYDYEKLTKGMERLNWGWFILSLFIAIMFSLFVFKIITDIGYQYY